MKYIFLFCATALSLSACTKAKIETYCGVENPEKDLVWLKEGIDKHKSLNIFVYKLTYKSTEGIFVYNDCEGISDCPLQDYFNCDGTPIFLGAGIGPSAKPFPSDFDVETDYREIIYSK